jgi:hypothetical protein
MLSNFPSTCRARRSNKNASAYPEPAYEDLGIPKFRSLLTYFEEVDGKV